MGFCSLTTAVMIGGEIKVAAFRAKLALRAATLFNLAPKYGEFEGKTGKQNFRWRLA